MQISSSNNLFGPKLSIKLKDTNLLLWEQHVEALISMHKLHRFLVNPRIFVYVQIWWKS